MSSLPSRTTDVGMLGSIRPTVNFANYFTAPPGMQWGPRTIPDCQLIYIVSGSASFEMAGKRLELSPGHCIFYGSDSPHRLAASPDSPLTLSSIHFSWDAPSPEPVHPVPLIRSCSEQQLSMPARVYTITVEGHGAVEMWNLFRVEGLDGLFQRIAREFLYREPGSAAVLRGYMLQLLATLLRFQIDKRFRAANERGKIAAAVEAIRRQPAKDWSTPELAAIAGYHPTYFASLFREATGYTPKHYLILERIKQAQLLLLREKSIEAVASRLGYSSVHYFCRNFKAVTGWTPGEFRKRNLEF